MPLSVLKLKFPPISPILEACLGSKKDFFVRKKIERIGC